MPCDYSKYPPNWFSEIVPAIRARSGDRCEGGPYTKFDGHGARCDAPNGAIIVREPGTGGNWRWATEDDTPELCTRIVLTVAHLDHDPENHDVPMDRLAHLCQRCHLRYDLIENQRKRRERRDAERGQTRFSDMG